MSKHEPVTKGHALLHIQHHHVPVVHHFSVVHGPVQQTLPVLQRYMTRLIRSLDLTM